MKKSILLSVMALLCLFFKASAQSSPNTNPDEISGFVMDELTHPLPGATIKSSKIHLATVTDSKGVFKFKNVNFPDTLLVSFVGYETAKIIVAKKHQGNLSISLKPDRGSLNEIQIIGYGKTTKRLNTGSVSTITAKEIEDQPVTNILSALSGRAAGVSVQTSNGLPGGSTTIQIRGKGSILAGTDPLYVIDGVPFSSTFLTANSGISASSINGVVSPFNSINPDDIESISILKDADATAIYGSRGANGVVLITTKKGKAGLAKVNFNISQGINKVANLPSVLNLPDYLTIRKEAFANDGLTYAPDLTVWSQLKGTNWPKYILGGTGHTTDVQSNISGGDSTTVFAIGGNFHTEKTYLPGDNLYQRGGIRYQIQHTSTNKKFIIALSGTYNVDGNHLVNASVEGDLFLPPNFPLYNSAGGLNWAYGINPIADLKAQTKIKTDNLVSNLVLTYNFTRDLSFTNSVGYNKINVDQTETFPLSSLNPQYSPVNYAYFSNNSNESFIIEPQLNYKKQFTFGTVNILAGGTFQSSLNNGLTVYANNFSSDELLENLASAGTISSINNFYLQYKYVSEYGRINYNIANKYIFNASIRRDGSSRFGPGDQFGTFGAMGAAWLFGQEDWVRKNLHFLSFGKIRGSYGIVGNDQINDYQYLSTYSSSGYSYQDVSGLQPSRIANSDFHWEVDKKLEFALETGFLKDRIYFSADYYQSRSSDQLVEYTIPTITGFSSYTANLPAVVQNTGWEFELKTKNIDGANFKWTTSFNLTIPKNKLVSFQNLANSSYANTLTIGQDITRIYGYQLSGIDPKTGSANYAPQPGNNSSDPYYYSTLGKQTPDLYGGFGNSLSYKNFTIDIFGQFTKQMAQGDIKYTPGIFINNYHYVLQRWQQPGDVTVVPKATTIGDYNYAYSSGNFFDASYFRLKNIAISYAFTGNQLKRLGLSNMRFYLQGQNLYTWWHRQSPFLDPESGAFGTTNNLPPVTSFVVGIQVTL
jgi:TonB-linked SusC/RagA family outer membrane protein